jgi:hypothetical protein
MTTKKPAGAKALAPKADELAFLAQLKREQLANDVQNECTLYRNTGDGRFLWRAFLRLHGAKEPIPQAILDRLAHWGGRLLGAQDPKEIAAALELSGDEKKHIGPKQSESYRKRWRLASEVCIVRDLYKISLTKAIAAVARNSGLSVATVKGAYDDVFRAPLRERKSPTDLTSALNNWR